MHGYHFTERVRKVLAMARDEAVRLRHEYVGTEHILLALVREGDGIAMTAIENLGVAPAALTAGVEEIVKRGLADERRADKPFTSRAKKALELAMTEARDLGHDYVGTEHLLLGLLRERKGIGGQVLIGAGLSLDRVREEIVRLLGMPGAAPDQPAGREASNESERVARRQRSATTSTTSSSGLPQRLRRVVTEAYEAASVRGRHEVSPVHLAIALFEHGEGTANAALDRLGFDRAAALVALDALETSSNARGEPAGPEDVIRLSETVIHVLDDMDRPPRRGRDARPWDTPSPVGAARRVPRRRRRHCGAEHPARPCASGGAADRRLSI